MTKTMDEEEYENVYRFYSHP